MRRYIPTILAITLIATSALAAAPDLQQPPIGLQVDSGDIVNATGMDFLDHPQSGSVNFTPNTYDIHLPGDLQLPVQDVVAYNGERHPLKDCKDFANFSTDALKTVVEFFTTKLFAVTGLKPDVDLTNIDKTNAAFVKNCTSQPSDKQNTLFADRFITHQVLADVRNISGTPSDGVEFSGKSVDPYLSGLPQAGFPQAPGGVGVTVDLGSDAGSDAVVMGAPYSFFASTGFSKPWNTPMLSASLTLLRFVDNKVLTFNSLSSGWLDRPLGTPDNITNPQCFTASADGKSVVPKSDPELLKAGCLGEGDVVGITTPHLFTNTNKALEDQGKSKDLVVLSRSLTGDPQNPMTKIGYLTVYRRTPVIPSKDNASIFQDMWQFEKSVTYTTKVNGGPAPKGIPEPYGIAVLKGRPTDSVLVTSSAPIFNAVTHDQEYFIYRYDGKNEPVPIRVGCNNGKTTPTCRLTRRSASPYKIYTADIDGDSCEDILLVRANLVFDDTTKAMSIQFAPYFDLFLQGKGADGQCNANFSDIINVNSIAQNIPQWDPQVKPQVSSLAVADFNKDPEGRLDVIAGDFSLYVDPATKSRASHAYFLENKNGLLDTMKGLPNFVVSTKEHGADVGVIEVKSDTHANVAAVISNAVVYKPITLPPPVINIPDPCKPPIGVGAPQPPPFCFVCSTHPSDGDGDGINDISSTLTSVTVETCDDNSNPITKQMNINGEAFKYTPDCSKPEVFAIKSGREWLHEWAGCDNCSPDVDNCTEVDPEAPAGTSSKCWNKNQADSDLNGYGDVCTSKQNAGSAAQPKPAGTCQDGTPFYTSWLKFKAFVNGAWEPELDNDKDNDGVPDCMVDSDKNGPFKQLCGVDCDSCNPQHVYGQVECVTSNPDGGLPCANPAEKQKNSAKYCGPKTSSLHPLHEDKVIYADDQPVIAYKEELKLTEGPVISDNGHEVTVLLNKTNAKGILPLPSTCHDGTLDCNCPQYSDQLICKCQKDPKASGCATGPDLQVTCCLDVCRGDLTAPFDCKPIVAYNDEIRKITGLCMDVLVPVEGTQYHLSCTMPSAPTTNGKPYVPVVDLSGGRGYVQVFKAVGGQIPRNYFKDWHRPVASRNLLSNNVLLNPVSDVASSGNVPLDLSQLPKPDFAFDASLSAVAPDASIKQAPGITQIDGIMQIETYLANLDSFTGAPVTKGTLNPDGSAPTVTRALLLDIKGYSSPAGCQWNLPDCPDVMPNPPPPQAFVDAIRSKVAEYEAAGKPITIDTINDAFASMDVGPAFMHQKFVVAGSQGAMAFPVQNILWGSGAEGGCGCNFAVASSMPNTVLPLLMAAVAGGGMLFLRRKSAKKR